MTGDRPVRFCERLWLKRRGLLSFLQWSCAFVCGDHERSEMGR
jgi:hypothetical protein